MRMHNVRHGPFVVARGTLSRVTPDGRIQVLAALGGDPNGAAIGPDGAVYVCNNGGFNLHTEHDGCFRPVGQADNYSGGRIERVNLATGRVERVYESVDAVALHSPNDIVFDAHGGFYFTDLGKTRANDITASGQVHKDRWPSPHGGRMLVAAPGGHYQRFDSMALDARGHLCVATLIHGGITIVAPDGSSSEHIPLPDRYTTNLCCGGKDMRTAFVTLSGSGRLIAIDDWPVAGLALQYPG